MTEITTTMVSGTIGALPFNSLFYHRGGVPGGLMHFMLFVFFSKNAEVFIPSHPVNNDDRFTVKSPHINGYFLSVSIDTLCVASRNQIK